MPKESITEPEYLTLLGLAYLGKMHAKRALECESAMDLIILEDECDSGASDVLFGDRDVQWMLDRSNIKVVAK